MIVGNGMMAKAFSGYAEDPKHIIFASGVSNSQEKDRTFFARESQLLEQTILHHPDQKLVYFSTCSLYDPSLQNSPYVQHKQNMEQQVQRLAQQYLIVRLPQVVGNATSPTIINFLYQAIIHQQPFILWQESYRNLIDIDDVVTILNEILANPLFTNQIINVATDKMINVQNIVIMLENITKITALYQSIPKGSYYSIDIAPIRPILAKLHLNFAQDYVQKTLEKYYSPK
ncbi:NAD-dependent epimerase/dehydratase family protein [Lonepinella sp. MS14435]|uniref:NAD-dependent epimerase/dehydratase family protein n=1 Tax=Lonepinella sp. MS14435 TaxID=3003618 RepID=UPI0036D8F8E7